MNHDLVSWRAEPDFRGTFTIFTSCMSTLSICIRSALHVDIQKGRSKPIQYLAKGGWLIVGLLCPELLLFNAFHQLKQAIRLTRDGQRMLYLDGGAAQPRSRIMQSLEDWLVGGKPSATSAEPLLDAESSKRTEVGFESVVRKHDWTLAHGFYAAMGGFVLKDPYVDRSDDHYLPSWQHNGVITPDGVRFLMQHAPSLIPDLALDDILDRSKADGLAKTLLVWQVLWFLLTCINRLVQGLPLCLLEISTIAHALCSLLTYALWWYKPKDVSHPTAILAPDARLIGAWMSMASMADQYLIGGILKVDIPCEMTYVEVVETDNGIGGARISFQRPEERASALPASRQQKPPRRTPRDVFRDVLHSRRTRLIFGAATLPWYVQGSSETPEEMRATTLRCALASEAHHKYGLARPAPETPMRLVVPVASLQAFTDTHEHEFAGILRTSVTAAVLTAVYGLPHLIGYTVSFPSATEGTLWRVATVLVAAIGVALGGIMVVTLGTLMLLQKLLELLTGGKAGGRLVERAELPLERFVLSVGAVLYVSSSGYLVVESVRQLFALPSAAFALPSWGSYWPHFS